MTQVIIVYTIFKCFASFNESWTESEMCSMLKVDF